MGWPKGKKQSLESNAKRRAAMLRRMGDPKERDAILGNLRVGQEAAIPSDQRTKIGAALSGRPKSVTHRRNLAEANLGKKQSEATKAKRSAALKRHYADLENRKKMRQIANSPNNLRGTGRKQSAEERAMRSRVMRESWKRRGRKHKPSTIAKMKASRAQQIVPVRDTVPEVAVQRILERAGVQFVKHGRIRATDHHRWDLKVPGLRLLIEVDGCYWHGCDKCIPENRRRTEQSEIDRIRTATAMTAGWTVVRIWEHEVNEGKAEGILLSIIRIGKQGIFEGTT